MWTKIELIIPGSRDQTSVLFDQVAALAVTHSELLNEDWYMLSQSADSLDTFIPEDEP